jgi:hypothetical protein
MARGETPQPWTLSLTLLLTLIVFIGLSLVGSPAAFGLPAAPAPVSPAEVKHFEGLKARWQVKAADYGGYAILGRSGL